MKKIFYTKLSEEEILDKLNNKQHNSYRPSMLRAVNPNKLSVSSGRGITYWKLYLENPGVIIIKRCMSRLDWLTLLALSIIDIVIAILALSGGFEIPAITLVLAIIAFELLILYLSGVLGPMIYIKREFEWRGII